MNQHLSPDAKETTVRPKPFRKAVLKGLALIAPPLLTLVLFLWAWNTIEGYILRPLENTARYMIFVSINDIKTETPGRPVGASGDSVGRQKFADEKGSVWVKIRNKYIPVEVCTSGWSLARGMKRQQPRRPIISVTSKPALFAGLW